MLPIDQIIPFIRHEDPWVVDLAMHCLEWVRWPQRLTGDFVLEAVKGGYPQLSHWLADFTPSAAVLDYAVEVLSEPQGDREAYWFYGVIDRAPDELITPELARSIERLSTPSPKIFVQPRVRRQTMQLSTETIRDRFLRACAVADRDGTAMSEHRDIRLLADRLAYRGDVEWAGATLQQIMGSNQWAETWLLAILTKCRYRPALNWALDRFATTNPDENEAFTSEIKHAVSELCAPEDLPRVSSLWNSSHPDNRSYLLEGVCRLRFPEAEPILLEFVKAEEDLTMKTIGAVGLCEMLCGRDESREFIAATVDGEAFDISFADLEQVAIPLGIIQGRPFPQEAQWRNRLGEAGSRDSRRREILREKHGDWAGVFDRLRAALQDQQHPALAQPQQLAPTVETAQLSRAKTVGRNDPCPCGSGKKKYKKCCLLKE